MTGRRGALDVTPYGWLLCSVAGSVAGAAARCQYGREAPPRLVGEATFLLAGAPVGLADPAAGPRTGGRRNGGIGEPTPCCCWPSSMHAAFTGGRRCWAPPGRPTPPCCWTRLRARPLGRRSGSGPGRPVRCVGRQPNRDRVDLTFTAQLLRRRPAGATFGRTDGAPRRGARVRRSAAERSRPMHEVSIAETLLATAERSARAAWRGGTRPRVELGPGRGVLGPDQRWTSSPRLLRGGAGGGGGPGARRNERRLPGADDDEAWHAADPSGAPIRLAWIEGSRAPCWKQGSGPRRDVGDSRPRGAGTKTDGRMDRAERGREGGVAAPPGTQTP